MKVIIVSGLSGSGKSTALHALEDLGYYCIDNLPIGMLPSFADQVLRSETLEQTKFGIGIDARNLTRDLGDFRKTVTELREKGIDCEVIYLRAQDDELIKRFSETRRKHPLTEGDVPHKEALERERKILDPVVLCTDLTIDTTRTNIHQLRDQLAVRLVGRQTQSMSVQFLSFGYKHGLPADADFVFDIRCLPNPHWVPELRSQTGRDAGVISFLEQHEAVTDLRNDIAGMLEKWLPAFQTDNRSYITVAVGCTGGQHRSVYFVEQLARHFSDQFPNMLVRHREIP